MALKQTITLSSGLQMVDAYQRVESISLAGKTFITFKIRSYKDTTFPYAAEQEYTCAYNISGSNPITQAYDYLKTLPEFSGAVDC